MIESARYTEHGFIIATIDGQEVAVPLDPQNRDRQALAEWEAQGNTITPYNPPPPSNDDINTERERRIAAGTTISVTDAGNIPVQGREVDVRNMQGLGMAAFARISNGDTTTITEFRDADNAMHGLTPPQMFELWQKSAEYAQVIYEASWALKAMHPILADFADDKYWPE